MTDHKPLTSILGPKKGIPPTTATRLQHWALKLSAYSYDNEFRHTHEQCNADGLSRLPLNHVSVVRYDSEAAVLNLNQLKSLAVTAKRFAAATRHDRKVYYHITKGWPKQVKLQ